MIHRRARNAHNHPFPIRSHPNFRFRNVAIDSKPKEREVGQAGVKDGLR
jgi:hypothetical protein